MNFERVTASTIEKRDSEVDVGLRASMKALMDAIPKENIRSTVDTLATHSDDSLTEARKLSNYAEINAMAAHFAEHIWKNATNWMKENPLTLGSGRFINSTFVPVPYEEVERMFEKDPSRGLQYMRKLCFDTLYAQAEEFFEKTHDAPIEVNGKPSYEARAFARYSDLLLLSGRAIENDMSTPEKHVWGGLDTATELSFTLLEAIPRTFNEKFGRMPSNDELRKLTEAGREFVLYLASLEASAFSTIQERIIKGDAREETSRMHGLDIREKNGSYYLDLKPDYLTAITSAVKNELSLPTEDRSRIGCPAIAARGPEGKNLIVEMYDWIASLTWKFYYSRITGEQKQG